MRGPLIGARRDRGANYLLMTTVAFGVTVVAVRFYLDWAGYPQVGGGGIHVAHMLWGGLLLILAAVVLQLRVGRRALVISSLAAGVGTGLFIDEVGKFLTQTNDYFFAPAAPIIYGAVLLLGVIWLSARRDRSPSVRDAEQGAVEALRDLADDRLTAPVRDRAVSRLDMSGAAAEDGSAGAQLKALLTSPMTDADLSEPGFVARGGLTAALRRLVPASLERVLIWIGLLLSVLTALISVLVLLLTNMGHDIPIVPSEGPIEIPSDPVWIALYSAVAVVVGAGALVALALDLVGSHRRAMTVALFAVLAMLTLGGLLDLFIAQEAAIVGVLVQVGLLLLIIDRRDRLDDEAPGPVSPVVA